jgi:hypothetical protein
MLISNRSVASGLGLAPADKSTRLVPPIGLAKRERREGSRLNPGRLMEHPPEPGPAELRATALRSAMVLRDCSFRLRSTEAERRACRTVMRRQAMRWRDPLAEAW